MQTAGDEITQPSPTGALRSAPKWVAIALWGLGFTAAVVTPAVWSQTFNAHAFHPRVLVTAIAILGTVGLVALLATIAVTRSASAAIRIAAITVFAIFWWSILRPVAEWIASPLPLLTWEVVLVGLLTIVVVSAVRLGDSLAVALIMPTLMMAVLIAEVVSLQALEEEPQPIGSVVSAVGSPDDRPNVIMLVLDGRPRTDVLWDLYDYDDAAFRSRLQGMGFEFNDAAVSNYNRTFGSISAMLALDPLISPDVPSDDVWPRVRGVSGGDGEMLRAFQRAGYRVRYSVSGWNGSRCGSVVDECDAPLMVHSTLYWMLRGSIFSPIVPEVMRHPWAAVSEAQIASMAARHRDVVDGGQPTVTWMHVVAPHPPLSLDAECKRRGDSWRTVIALVQRDEFDEDRIGAFTEQVECVDRLVADALEEIILADPHVVVFVVSDHGSESLGQDFTDLENMSPAQVREKLAVLHAFRGPRDCSVTERRTTVGAFREVVACILDAEVDTAEAAPYLVLPETSTQFGNTVVPLSTDDVG